MGLADFLIETEKGKQRFGLTRRDSAMPFGRRELYDLGLNKASSPRPDTAGVDNQANTGQGALALAQPMGGGEATATTPGQQPGTPFNMAAVNDVGEGGMKTGMKFDADNFARLAGAFGAAIAPKDSWQSRLGATASQLASENIKKREDAPDDALKRKLTEARISHLEKPDTIKDSRPTKQKEFEFFQSLSTDQQKAWKAMDTDGGGDKRSTKQKEFEFFQSLSTDQQKAWKAMDTDGGGDKRSTKQKEFEFYDKLDPKQKGMWDKLYGKTGSKGDDFSYQDKKQYEYMIGKLEALDERLVTPDFDGNLPSEEEVARIQAERDAIIEGMSAIESRAGAGGMSRSGGPGEQPGAGGGQSDMDSVKNAIQQAKDAGIPMEQVQSYWSSPGASAEGFAQQFLNQKGAGKPGEAVAAEIPDMKNQPITTTSGEKPAVSEGMQRQKVPYNTSMTGRNTPEQDTAAIQELTDLAHNLGVGPGNWKALGALAKDLGGWAWESYQNAFNSLSKGLLKSQKESRKQLPAYK